MLGERIKNVKQAAEQVAFRIEMGDFTAEEMYLVRACGEVKCFMCGVSGMLT